MSPEQIEVHLERWDGLAGGRATLVNLSENHTFRVDRVDGNSTIVRVHRQGYHTREGIESELTWLRALNRDTDLPTVTPIAGRDGQMVQDLTGDGRYAVAFAFEAGVIPEEGDDLADLFPELGRFAAICHAHVESWTRPQGFRRPVWNTAAILDANGLWGDWRVAPNVDGEVREVIGRVDCALRDDFAAYGTASDRFGLIHADMRLANVLVAGSSVRLIDFDDCGFGWFVYDFGAAISFFEHDASVPDLRARWLEGYRSVRPLPSEHEAMLPAAAMLRRMALLAWIGSHSEVDLARMHAPDFASDTAQMAEAYLSRR